MAALVLAAISCTDSFKSGTGNPVPSCLHKKIIHASDNAGRGRRSENFVYYTPTEVVFGKGSESKSGSLAADDALKRQSLLFCHIFKEFQANQRKSLPLRTEWVRLSFCGQKSVNDPQNIDFTKLWQKAIL